MSFVLSPLLTVVPSSVPSVSAFSCSSGGPGYDVRAGDGWFAIADRAAVEVRSLLAVNDASSDDALHPGDGLCLPSGADLTALCAATATVGAGDGLFRIADRTGSSLASLLAANGADAERALHPGDIVCLPAGATGASASPASTGSSGSTGTDYTVVSGDSWFGIAERAGTTVSALLRSNDASAERVLYPGQQIRLPAGVAAPASSGSSGGSFRMAAAPTQGPCWFSDSWGDARPGGRRHVGADVFTLSRAYVYAVADGRLTMRKWAQPGNISGNAWRLTADDGTAYFYAHLFDFAPDLRVGSRVEAGQIIGWVGATGNTDAEHLHFEIRPGGGGPIDPHPTLRAQGACKQGTPYTQPGGWVPD